MKGNSLAVSALSNWSSIAVNLAITFLLTPFIISKIGNAGYGIWVLVLSIVGYYGLLDLGLHSATIRYVARYVGLGDREALGRTVSTAILCFAAIGTLVLFLSFFIADPLTVFFRIPAEDAVSFKYMIWLIGAAAGLGFPRRVFDAVLMAHENFVLLNALEIAFSILRALAFTALLSTGYGLIGIGLAELGIEIVNFSGKLTLIYRARREIGFSVRRVNRKTAMALFSFGALTFITLIGDTLRFNIDSAVIGRCLNMEAVGIYGIAFALIRVLIRASNASTIVTFPRLSRLAGSSPDLFRERYLAYSRFCGAFIAGLTMGLVLLSPGFILLWVGEAYREAAAVVTVLGGALALDYMTTVSINALKALNRLRFYALQTVIEGIVKVALAVVFVRYWGIVGVAAATAAPMAVTKLLVQPLYTARVVGTAWWPFFRETLLKPMLAASITGVVFRTSGIFSEASIGNLVMGGAAAAAGYGLVGFIFILDKAERNAVKSFLLRTGRLPGIRRTAPQEIKKPD